jgi:hypothetical protein
MALPMPTRRSFLVQAGLASAVATTPVLARSVDEVSPDVGRKFYADGRVHPFAGNTVVCHLPQQGEHSATFNALLDVYRELPAQRFASKLAVVPPSSWHMTVFGGVNDRPRTPATWPKGIPVDAPIAEVTRIIGERIRAANLSQVAPIRMRVDTGEGGPDRWTMRLHLIPSDAAETAKLRSFRDALAAATGIRSPTHDSYAFHITIGYWLSSLAPDEELAFRAAISRWRRSVATASPVVSFGTPEYCFFKDMFAFERQFFIGT